ncbi:hypothetical protein ABZ912_25550 [Nonomuraea angiospora]|uniref:hypothetical protein n=1 Tax=Nonomuraea angiospora TaxID=46172 RepID=UPI0033D80B9C
MPRRTRVTSLTTVEPATETTGPSVALPSRQVSPYVPGAAVSEPPFSVTFEPSKATTSSGYDPPCEGSITRPE